MQVSDLTDKQRYLIGKYYKRGLTLRQLGSIVGFSRTTISKILNRQQVKRRSSGSMRQSIQPDTSRLLEEFTKEFQEAAKKGGAQETSGI